MAINTSAVSLQVSDALLPSVWGDMFSQKGGFIGEMVAGNVRMPYSEGTVYEVDIRDDQLNDEIVGAGEEAPLLNLRIGAGSNYKLVRVRRRVEINPDDLAKLPMNMRMSYEKILLEFGVKSCALAFEKLAAVSYFTAGNWANSSPSTKWDVANTKYRLDLLAAAEEVIPYVPYVNHIIFGRKAYNSACNRQFEQGSPYFANEGVMRQKLLDSLKQGDLEGLERIDVGRAFYTSQNPLDSTSPATRANLWNENSVWLGFTDFSDRDLMTESAVGKVWTQQEGDIAKAFAREITQRPYTKPQQLEGFKNTEIGFCRGYKIFDSNRGYLLTAVNTP